jgi:ketosteroid isomerase-like protein
LAVSAAVAAPAPEETAIREVLVRQQEAWNRGDIPGFMAGYENSPATTFVGAAVTRGYQPVLESYAKRYPTRDAMGKLTFSEVEVHLLGNAHAWAMGRFFLERNAAGGGDKGGRFTLVLKRTKAGWKIVLDHTS